MPAPTLPVTHLLLVYLHLIATCAAVGLVLATDLRVAGLLWTRIRHPEARREPLRLQPPSAFVVRVVAVALVLLVLTGIGLVALALELRADALENPKLQGKLVFVGLLVLNALALHRVSLPALAGRDRAPPARGLPARLRRAAWVTGPVAISQATWAWCAFLGVARAWNFTQPLDTVLGLGLLLIGGFWLVCIAVVAAASAPPIGRITPIPTLNIAPDPPPAAQRA